MQIQHGQRDVGLRRYVVGPPPVVRLVVEEVRRQEDDGILVDLPSLLVQQIFPFRYPASKPAANAST